MHMMISSFYPNLWSFSLHVLCNLSGSTKVSSALAAGSGFRCPVFSGWSLQLVYPPLVLVWGHLCSGIVQWASEISPRVFYLS